MNAIENIKVTWLKLWRAIIQRWPFIVLAIIALLHIIKIIQVDGYGVGLLLLAFLPAILPIFTKYFKILKISTDGIEATAVADNDGKIISQNDDLIVVENDSTDAKPLFPLTLEERRIMATLWHYQKELFGEGSDRRWGFGIGIGASDYNDFRIAVSKISDSKYVHIDKNGICYLTNDGVNFCKLHRAVLDGDGPYYTSFGPVPKP